MKHRRAIGQICQGFTVLVGFVAFSLLTGCEKDEVRTYRVAKETPPPTPAQASPTATAPVPADPASDSVTWTPPAGWTVSPAQVPMRVATLIANSAEIAVSAFPGEAGGATANVNRWRGQIGLPPWTDDEVLKAITTAVVEGVTVSTLKLQGAEQHMLVGIINPGDGNTWFVKSTGKTGDAAALEPDFVAFCRSFRISGKPSANPSGKGTAANSGVLAGLSMWTAPTGWKQTPDPSGIASAMYSVDTPHGPVRVTATSLVGDGGGILANINRWRTQMGLETLSSLKAQPQVDIGVPGVIVVDLSDAGGERRMVAAVAPDSMGSARSSDLTWFFKMSGSAKSVGMQLESFKAMVRAALIEGAK